MSITLDDIVDRQSKYNDAEKLAMLHRRVSIVGYNPLLKKSKRRSKQPRKAMNINELNGMVPVCGCCGRFPRNFLSLNFEISEIGFLGQGYALYFTFQKLCILMLTLFYLLAISSKPIYQWARRHTSKRFLSSMINQTDLLCLNVTIVCALCILLMSKYMVNLAVVVDEIDTSPQDYSVLVKNIPLVFSQKPVNIEEQLINFFENSYKLPLKVEQVCMYYNLVPLNCIETHKKRAIDLFKAITPARKIAYEFIVGFLFKGKEGPKRLSEYHGVVPFTEAHTPAKFTTKNPEQFCKERINMLTKRIDEGYANNNMLFIGEAVVSFQCQSMAQYLLSDEVKRRAYFFGNELVLQKPQHPKGIYWYNLHLDEEDYKIRNMFSKISCAAIFLCSLFLQVLLNYLKISTEGTKYETKIFGLFSTIIINVINIVIPSFILRFFSSFQGHRSRTQELMSFVKKSLLLQVMNTLVVPLIVVMFFGRTIQSFFQISNGVMFRNAFFSVIQLMFSAKYLFKNVVIYAHRKGYKLKGIIPKHLTVRQLCQLYEYPPFQIELRSSDILKTMLVTFFLGFEVKKVILYAMISFYFNYWIDKYNLSRRRTVRSHVNSTLNIYMMRIMQLCTPLFIAGQLLLHNPSFVKIFLLVLSLMSFYKPFIKLVKADRSKDEVGKNLTYKVSKQKLFETDYRRENPALRGLEKEGFARKKMTESAGPPMKKVQSNISMLHAQQ